MSDPLRGWKETTVGVVLSLEYGKPLPMGDRSENGKHPAFGANGVKCKTDKFYCDKPSIIVGRKGSAGELTLTPEKYWPLDVTYYVDFDRSQYDLMFLYHLLSMLNLPSLATGVKPGINRNRVYELAVRVPPLSEQRRIVSVLDAAFAGLATATAHTQKNLQNARELFDSYLSDIFATGGPDWGESTLDHIAENLDRKRIPITKSERKAGVIPYYGASGVVDHVADHIFDEDLLLISEDGANLLARTYPIAFSVSGKTWVNNHAHVLRFKDESLQEWVESYINHILIDDYVTGAAQPKLNQKALNSIPIKLPPREEIADYVARFGEMRSRTVQVSEMAERKLASLSELKQSLLHRAFRGELSGGVIEKEPEAVA